MPCPTLLLPLQLGVVPGRSAGEYMGGHYRKFYPHSCEWLAGWLSACWRGEVGSSAVGLELRLASSCQSQRSCFCSYCCYAAHAVGHWIGLDTHDTSTASHDRPLEPGQHQKHSSGRRVSSGPCCPS